ncbi:MAG: lipopolysaccharide heptosyltransferase II [Candidatus Sumerlaeota bacterium]|nr:lipopolysaccharide heptosyltransferase II [Candidatus Sumerlaeota bacterium]
MGKATKYERILIRAANWIGDAVMTTPAIRALRRHYPHARITLACRPWVAPVFEHSPDVDEVLPINDKGMRGLVATARRLRQGRYDLGVLFPNSLGSAMALRLGGVGRRVGYNLDGRGLFLSDAIPVTPDILARHMVEYYLNILGALLDWEKAEKKLVLVAGDKERREIQSVLERLGFDGRNEKGAAAPLIGVNPGATNGTAKRWLPERYAALSGFLVREHAARILVTGSEAEAEMARSVAAQAKEPKVVSVAGDLSLAQFIALTERLALFITNDSGAMHIAAAMGAPVVAVIGATDWRRTAPWSDKATIIRKELACAPCMLKECPSEHECMKAIQIMDVLKAAERLLRK